MAARIPRTRSRFGEGASPEPREHQLPWRFIAANGLVAILIGFGLLAYATANRHAGSSNAAFAATREYAVYAQFGTAADTIFQAPASRPSERRKLFEIPHAREYGVVPSLAPGGKSFAYMVLPPEILAPAPDSPAELWLAALDGAAGPRRLGGGFDLLVRPLWTPDGRGVVVRRSAGASGPYELIDVALEAPPVTLAASSSALFPVGFSIDRSSLYYAVVDQDGSDLYRVDVASLESAPVAHFSDGLTRDWSLSSDGGRLAFLSLVASGDRVSSRVGVLDLVTGAVTQAGPAGADQFGPSWSPSGELTYGALAGSRARTGVIVGEGGIAPPARGFDVPLAWSPSGSALAVRTFDGSSVTAPGRAVLTLLAPDGSRQQLAYGEVTFIGWTNR